VRREEDLSPGDRSFRLIIEIEPPRGPDLKKVFRQIEMFGPITDAILVPDNHLGTPALSSIAIAQEIRKQGFNPIVVLNARDRNILRLRSDLITLRSYEIEEVLFVPGDPVDGAGPSLSLREMLQDDSGTGVRRGVLASIGKPLNWKRDADFLVTKLAFGRSKAPDWRKKERFLRPLYCGVIALSDRDMARRVLGRLPDLKVPSDYWSAFDRDGEAGFSAAIAELDHLKAIGIDGAHLVVAAHRRRFAEKLDEWVSSTRAPAS
jgi:methylenetetrahydrofolate reductase (NADPH)